MGYRVDEINEIFVLRNTIGGETYIVDTIYTCFRPISELGKEDEYCSHVAGYGTQHLYEGRCKFHFGRSRIDAALSSGRYASKLKRRLRQHYEEFSTDPDILNLLPELSLQRALLADAVQEYQNQFDKRSVMMALRLLQDIGHTVERIEKIHSQKVLTAATARLMMVEALNVASQFISEDKMVAFITSWKEKVLQRFSFLPMQDDLYDGEEL